MFTTESEQQNSTNKELNDTDIDTFSMEFMNDDDPNENFIGDGNINYSNSTSFEVVEETKVSHGMFIATRQVADTFFHQIAPSQILKVQLNPIMEKKQTIENVIETNIILKNQGMKKPSKNITSAIVFIFALLLVLCVYLKEQVDDWKLGQEDVKRKFCCRANNMKKIGIWKEEEKIWFVGIKSGKGVSVVLKKIGIFLTISVAICTMWAI